MYVQYRLVVRQSVCLALMTSMIPCRVECTSTSTVPEATVDGCLFEIHWSRSFAVAESSAAVSSLRGSLGAEVHERKRRYKYK